MPANLIPLGEYLLPLTLRIPTQFDPSTPRLGTVGEPELGRPVTEAQFAILRPITPDEHARFNAAVDALAKFRSARMVIHIALLNATEFEETLAEIQAVHAAGTHVSTERLTKLVIILNQRMLNLLSSMRTYVDHAEARLKRKHGDASRQVDLFLKATAHEFDTCFGYRFMYRLRNYTQHCGMPLGLISGGSSLPTPRPEEQPEHRIDFYFLRDELLSNFDKWGVIVKPELQSLPERFPLSAYVAESKESLKRIEAALAEIDKDDLKESTQFLKALQAETGQSGGTPCVYTYLELILDGGLRKINMNYTRFPLEAMAEVAIPAT
jgi:hypothetical protein